MAERPESSSPNSSRSLAERFGMTLDAVEDLLRGTHEEYAYPQSLPPVEDTPSAPIVEAAGMLAESEPMPTNQDNPTAPASSETSTTVVKTKSVMPVSGGFMAAIFTVLLIAFGIAASFSHGCFEQRKDHPAAKPIDTIQNMLHEQDEKASTPPEPPTQTPPGQVPPEALAVPNDKAPKTSEAAPLPHTSHAKLQTTSSFEAEEQLAELRADGNSKAHIKRIRKNGMMRYEVYSK